LLTRSWSFGVIQETLLSVCTALTYHTPQASSILFPRMNDFS
jgi:hypothetical protein